MVFFWHEKNKLSLLRSLKQDNPKHFTTKNINL